MNSYYLRLTEISEQLVKCYLGETPGPGYREKSEHQWIIGLRYILKPRNTRRPMMPGVMCYEVDICDLHLSTPTLISKVIRSPA